MLEYDKIKEIRISMQVNSVKKQWDNISTAYGFDGVNKAMLVSRYWVFFWLHLIMMPPLWKVFVLFNKKTLFLNFAK